MSHKDSPIYSSLEAAKNFREVHFTDSDARRSKYHDFVSLAALNTFSLVQFFIEKEYSFRIPTVSHDGAGGLNVCWDDDLGESLHLIIDFAGQFSGRFERFGVGVDYP